MRFRKRKLRAKDLVECDPSIQSLYSGERDFKSLLDVEVNIVVPYANLILESIVPINVVHSFLTPI